MYRVANYFNGQVFKVFLQYVYFYFIFVLCSILNFKSDLQCGVRTGEKK